MKLFKIKLIFNNIRLFISDHFMAEEYETFI
jgi:hypothetical protein